MKNEGTETATRRTRPRASNHPPAEPLKLVTPGDTTTNGSSTRRASGTGPSPASTGFADTQT